MTTDSTTSGGRAARPSFDRAAAVTRSLLGYGVLAGAFYLVVGIVQGLLRDGYEFTRHDLSLLANGPYGWIQVTNLIVTGVMVVVAAVGVRRAMRPGPAATWAPALLAAYGVGLIGAGVFPADPMFGFPPGTPDGPPATPTVAGFLHLVTAGLGFVCLVAACFVLAHRFARRGRADWAWYSRITAIVFLAGFVGIAADSGNPAIVLGF
ncbi:DUF998 domain-containing protein [Pseudonocardia nigra]|uniref:DUF998 domain-containing protein n=1 Tax=Pseudonocardia nigra TaxID=1921578 RepID=UPI001FE2E649|nr:DUF998 domain-containing protein [Pseudonocardia nigra]